LDECCLYYINRGKVDLIIEGKKQTNSLDTKLKTKVFENLQVLFIYLKNLKK